MKNINPQYGLPKIFLQLKELIFKKLENNIFQLARFIRELALKECMKSLKMPEIRRLFY